MTEHEASRTLVKSPPELWAECSDAASLTRHLDQFGEIRITRLEPETAVAWEGEDVSGTVRLEPSGWGTRVIMTASWEPRIVEPIGPGPATPQPRPDEPPPDPDPEPEPLPPAAFEPEPAPDEPAAEFPEPIVSESGDTQRTPLPALEAEPPILPPTAAAPQQPARPRGLLARLLERWQVESVDPPAPPAPPGPAEPPDAPPGPPGPPAPPGPVEPPEVPPAPPQPPDVPNPAAALTAALESLGQAHHRPFSRA